MAFATAERAGSRTPPLQDVCTPSAPRYGYQDSWQPYSPRKSARLASRMRANRTPSPRISCKQQLPSPSFTKEVVRHNDDTKALNMPSPIRKSRPVAKSHRRSSDNSRSDAAGVATAPLAGPSKTKQHSAGSGVAQPETIFPTPAKTPHKPHNEKTYSNIKLFGRPLFTSDLETKETSMSREGKFPDVATDDSTADEDEEAIIFSTEDRLRVVMGKTPVNPFYDEPSGKIEKRSSWRDMISVDGEDPQTLEEASQRDDGMIYVFRGKKFFRKFEDEDGHNIHDAHCSSIKPRLLFPPTKPSVEEEEEALTDIEDNTAEADAPETPKQARKAPLETPEAPRFAPMSPPYTKRTTRSTNRLADTPMKTKKSKSPFDSWSRTKEQKARTPASKRQGESMVSAITKRNRA